MYPRKSGSRRLFHRGIGLNAALARPRLRLTKLTSRIAEVHLVLVDHRAVLLGRLVVDDRCRHDDQ